MDKPKFQSKLLKFILEKIGVKLDTHKLKIPVDFSFILVEKVVIKLDKMLPFYLDFYRDMVDKEISLGKITSKNKVLHIGCGPVPATSILIADITNANVTGIDKNNQSVIEAKSFVSKLKNKNKISIIHGEADTFTVKEYDVIVFSQGIRPYRESLEHLSKEINPDTNLIFRTSSDINGKIKKNDFFIKDIFNIKDITYHEKNGLLISILLNKKVLNM